MKRRLPSASSAKRHGSHDHMNSSTQDPSSIQAVEMLYLTSLSSVKEGKRRGEGQLNTKKSLTSLADGI